MTIVQKILQMSILKTMINNKIIDMRYLLILSLLSPFYINSQVTLDYYLDKEVDYNQSIPTPESIIGHQVGEWHVSHDKLSQYVIELSRASSRIKLINRGKTYEDRPLWLLIFTSEENHSRLDEIQAEHLKLSNSPGEEIDFSEMPIVVYQGFSVHGDEPSGANASLLLMYHLAASDDPRTKEVLNNSIILVDPNFNPDGLQRFSQWANSNRSMNLNPDSNDREFNQSFPRGRTNHYWFDLNRDWLPNQLPETNSKVKTFTEWLPNILTDHHEMGTNSTFFFQPGVPERKNPLISDENQRLTKKIGTFHEKALNSIGSLYYSEESYDDFFFGKASTYPDANGSIGILFEQGSSRGHLQNSDNGLLSFPFTIKNQLTTAFSTLTAASQMRVELLTYMKNFYDNEFSKSAKDNSYIVFGKNKDESTVYHLAEILKSHKVKFNKLREDVTINRIRFNKDNSYVIPLNQNKRTLIKAMFNTQTKFADSLFYDVSAWTFPLAFNINYTETGSTRIIGEEIKDLINQPGSIEQKSDYAYVFEPHEYYTHSAVYELLKNNIRVKVATKKFSVDGKNYDYGTYLVPVKNQALDSEDMFSLLSKIAKKTHINIYAPSTGSTIGIDLGSNYFKKIELPKVAMLVGQGVRAYDAGEIWHLLDTRFNMPITKVDIKDFSSLDLSSYSHFIMPDYNGSNLNRFKSKIEKFISNGGHIIAYRNSINWISDNISEVKLKSNDLNAKDVSFEDMEKFYGAQRTGGSIFESLIDRTHPVNFGIETSTLPLFRNSNIYMEKDKNSFNNPIVYSMDPILSGYLSEENLSLLKGSAPFKIVRKGKGKIILITDNTNFRAFWYGTNRILLNSIFHSNIM